MEIIKETGWQVPIIFIIAVLVTGFIFQYSVNGNRAKLIIIMAIWLLCYSALAINHFFLNTTAFPPRFPFLILPSLIFMGILFVSPKGRSWIDNLDVYTLVQLNFIRVLIEQILASLCHAELVPVEMTYEGFNFDIISGFSAPIIALYCADNLEKTWKRNVLLAWNVIATGLLLIVVITAILSAPTPFQQLGFNQPNVGVLYFPFVWLPAFIVPIVLFSHLVIFRRLFIKTVKTAQK